VRIIGNVKGRRNWAYQLARKAESGQAGYRYTKITAYDAVAAGVLAASEIESARADLPENVFRELYLAEPSDDGGNPFGIAAIAAQVAPLSDGEPAVWGIDLAKSVDWTVCIALDEQGAVCRFERWQGPWQETTRRIVALIGRTPALVDSTGLGDPVLAALQAESPYVFEGYTFSAPSKQKLMEGLAVAIQQHEITYPDGPIVAELEAFEYVYTRTGVRYSAPVGLHDDCVMALALARQMAQRNHTVTYAPSLYE
jgi:phage FluMu gp28-like protein